MTSYNLTDCPDNLKSSGYFITYLMKDTVAFKFKETFMHTSLLEMILVMFEVLQNSSFTKPFLILVS